MLIQIIGFKTKSDRKSSTNFRLKWTKICTSVIWSILQSFLHFLKAKYINNCLKWHRKQFPKGTRENKCQSSGILWKHRQNFIISFFSPKLLSVSYEVQHSFSTFGVARNEMFLRRYLKEPCRSLQYNVNNLGTRVLSTCY